MKRWVWCLAICAGLCGAAARADDSDSATKPKPTVAGTAAETTGDAATTGATSTAQPANSDGGGQSSGTASGQSSGTWGSADEFPTVWFRMVARTQAEQPHWVTPMVTVTPRLEQEYRYDMSWQTQPDGKTTLSNYGGSKGLEVIPASRLELIINPPPYIVRSVNGPRDGYGDMSFLLKYRIFAGNEEHGNYIFTAFLGGSLPSGKFTNGAKNAVVTPTLAAGKGWGNFDVVSTFGAALPVDQTALSGRQILWNTTFQYRILRKIWPEVEINSTFFSDGPNDGKKQTFVTPGLVLGRFPIWKRLAVTVGGGVQIATTQYHQYNHKGIFTVRFPF